MNDWDRFNDQFRETEEERGARWAARRAKATTKLDPRDPRELDPGQHPMFRDHNCWKCQDGAKPCVAGSPGRCEFPHARND